MFQPQLCRQPLLFCIMPLVCIVTPLKNCMLIVEKPRGESLLLLRVVLHHRGSPRAVDRNFQIPAMYTPVHVTAVRNMFNPAGNLWLGMRGRCKLGHLLHIIIGVVHELRGLQKRKFFWCRRQPHIRIFYLQGKNIFKHQRPSQGIIFEFHKHQSQIFFQRILQSCQIFFLIRMIFFSLRE